MSLNEIPYEQSNLYRIRHTAAHVLAQAVLELYPETKLGIGPATDGGFFYDFQREVPFTPEDLEKIEARMWEIQKRAAPDLKVIHCYGTVHSHSVP